MSSKLVTYSLEGNIALIGLNRPLKRNAIDDVTLDALGVAVTRAQGDARVGIVFGHGDHFCAGLDLAEHAGKTPIQSFRDSRRWHATFDLIERGAIPFICAIHGAVIGGGIELAAATHLRVADLTAFFALPEGQRGIYVGGGGSVRLARIISATRMADMMLTGRVLSPAEAERLHLVHYLTDAGGALAKSRDLAAKIAANAAFSNLAIIQGLSRAQDLSHDDGLFLESAISALTLTNADVSERLVDFLEKRPARIAPEGNSVKIENPET